MPFLGLMCLVGAAVSRMEEWAALGYLLTFYCYLRPHEMTNLTAAQVVAPARGSQGIWGLLLAPSEEQRGSKTQQMDESVLVDWTEVLALGRLLSRRLRGLAAREKVLPYTAAEFARHFKMDVERSVG